LDAAISTAQDEFFTADEQAMVDGAANSEDVTVDVPYTLTDTAQNLLDAEASVISAAETVSLAEGETATVQQAQDLLALDNFDGVYDIADESANLQDQPISTATLINAAQSIEVTDAVSIADYQDLTATYDSVENWTYSIEDTAQNLLDNPDVVNAAVSFSLSDAITVAEYNNLAASFEQEFAYVLEDSLDNLVGADAGVVDGADSYSLTDATDAFEDLAVADALSDAQVSMLNGSANADDYTYSLSDSLANLVGADEGVVANADSYSLTDATDAFEDLAVADALSDAQVSMLNGASNADDYTYSLNDTLENLAGADEGVVANADQYTVDPDTVYDAGELSVAEANTEYTEASNLIDGAQNSGDLVLDDLFNWTVADTMENLVGAEDYLLEDAEGYSLTNVDTDLGELTGEEYMVVDGATNTDDYTFTVEPADPVAIDASSASVVEGNAIVFTVDMSHYTNEDRDLNYSIEGVETSVAGAADPVEDLGKKNGKVTIPAGESTATITLTPLDDGNTEGLEAFKVSVLDTSFEPVISSDNIIIEDPEDAGQNKTLTTGVDEFVTGEGNDTFTGLIDDDGTTDNSTFNELDSLDGDGGTDTLKLNVVDDDGAGFPSVEIVNIENFNLRTAVALTEDLTDYGFTDVNVLQNASNINLTAGDTTALNVTHAGASASTTLDGGSTQTVDVGNGAVTLTGASDAISVTHDDQVAGDDITTTHGTDVTVFSSADEDAGDITVGDGTDNQSGAVNITQNLTSDGAALTGGAITTTGGTTVDVTVDGTITADEAGDDGNAMTAGDITVNGDGNTTDVNVTQDLTANDYSKEAIDDVPATQVLTFDALAKDETVIVDGLTFTASKALTAEEVAQAFANLGEDSGAGNVPTVGDIVSDGGPVANGYFSGSTSGDWTSGAANGANVTFTADAITAAMTVNAGDVTPDSEYDAGTDNSGTAESADVSTTYGAVTIDEDGSAAASIENITVDGYGNSTIGSTNDVDALKTLLLTNSAGTMGVTTAAATLDLTVDDVQHNVTLTAASLLDLTLNAEGEESAFALTSANTTDLTIDAATDLDLTGSDFTALVNATISGAGAVVIDGATPGTLETLDAAGNSGGVTASVNGDATEVTGGDGEDDITVLNAGTAIDKEMSLGAGNDTLDISDGGTVTASTPTATLDGGDDTDTLVMDSAAAAAADSSFASKFTNFELLEIANKVDISAGDVEIDLSVLEYDHVLTNGTESGAVATSDGSFANALIFQNAANGSTFELNAAQEATGATGTDIGSIKINLEDASGTSDSLNLITDDAAGDVEMPDVETVNVTGKDSVTLKGEALTTVTVNGNDVATTDPDGNPLTYSDISVVLDAASTNVELVDASASKGAFTFDSLDDSTATVINGGEGNDEISISGSNDEVYAGAGDDKITIAGTASASKAEGGDGNDLFDVTGATLGKEAYATILDFDTGDQIQINASDFKSEGVVVTDPEAMTLTDWFTAAFNQTTAGESIWFEHNDNTYIVDNTTTDDVVVKLSGVYDLENGAAFNDSGILEAI
jgi:S-layer protein